VGHAPVCCILLTHGHADHVGALEEVRNALGVPVGIHPADADAFGLRADFSLSDGKVVEVGRSQVSVVHVPGHTPGSVCLRLDGHAVVGDAIFPGGPGHTISAEALEQSLGSLHRTIFVWADEIELHPGHGGTTTVGAERVRSAKQLGIDTKKHIKDIADKYIVPGVTTDGALMFLPSEAVYAELHTNFMNVVDESHRRRVYVVSPSTLMATISLVSRLRPR
jgi:glyoxylase-like metal-dependent hydrolase (beta-lactamase superfamily II)